ncbi:hypothetical protein BGX29_001410 [Mortierella sp. GBA35]|nr:hypothetical protein BGX29_001410 [Mortierella sp. GBA35]
MKSPHTLSLARTLIDQPPDYTLRDVLHSVAHLTLVQEALVTSTTPPTNSGSARSKRPKRSSTTPTGSRHASSSPRLDHRPTRHDLSATRQQVNNTAPLTPQMQHTRKQLLVLIHRVNVYYSKTFNTADAVTCLLNIAHRALDQQSVPIRSPTSSVSSEPTAGQPASASASTSVSALPTPPRTMKAEIIVPVADDILNSLAMVLIQYPRYKHIPSSTASQAHRENQETGDDCDLSDALLEMLYALLDHEYYNQRPLAILLSEFLVQTALQRERRFQERWRRQKRKFLFAAQSLDSYSSGRSIDRWRRDLARFEGAGVGGVDGFDREPGMDGDDGVGSVDGVESEIDMQGKGKKRFCEQQLQRCQPRLQGDQRGACMDDWSSSVMRTQPDMDSPFVVN